MRAVGTVEKWAELGWRKVEMMAEKLALTEVDELVISRVES